MKVYIDCNDKTQRKEMFDYVHSKISTAEKHDRCSSVIRLGWMKKIEAVMERQEEIIEEQEERIAIMSEGEWHKITDSPDSLPKKSGEYIVAIELTFICTGGKEIKKRVSEKMEYDADFHDFTQNGGVFHPTHWMNLPKPPEEGAVDG